MSEKIPLGDILDALFFSSGFTTWFEAHYTCKCDKRRALFNYIKLKGPAWLAQWIREHMKPREV